MCGFPKDSFFYFQAWWGSKPVLHVFPHWNWPGLEGKEIAVWVYSNLDRVELFLNGQSLGAKEMKKDSHLAWNVKYTPGAIEARGYKDGQQVMTAKRETAGPAAKLALMADRQEISADGEDVAMFAVEVRDAQDRLVPMADNQVSFRVSGQGKAIGVGNGDPTSHEPDQGSSRKAFSGLCMALVESTKAAGSITVEASAPGLTPASVTISSRAVKLRPQVAVWEPAIPAGEGITGRWRPGSGPSQVFTFQQNGNSLTGTVEGDTPTPIESGKVDGANISFSAANVVYAGTVKPDAIELRRTGGALGGRGGRGAAAEPAGPRPAIGPPPDGTDPSRGVGGRGFPTPAPMVLHRAKR
jgi:beta-galactosidase